MVGKLDSTKAAGIFNASTRYVTAGLMVGVAVQQGRRAQALGADAQRSFERARGVYQTTTAWLMVATWPLYFTFAVFARRWCVSSATASQAGPVPSRCSP